MYVYSCSALVRAEAKGLTATSHLAKDPKSRRMLQELRGNTKLKLRLNRISSQICSSRQR